MQKPKNTQASLVTFSITINGENCSDEMQVLSIQIKQGVNQISTAKIVLLDGDLSKGTFDLSSSKLFVPGNKITIKAGYDLVDSTVFQGIITNQEINVNPEQGSSLIIDCKDESVKMTVGRKSKTFKKKTDSEIISSIIDQYSGLKSTVQKTDTTWPEQVQYDASDWDFIMSRAQVNGLIVTNLQGHVQVTKMDRGNKPVMTATYGENVLAFNAKLDSVSQLDKVSASSWDFKIQEVITGSAASENPGPGNLSTKKLSKVVGLSNFELKSSANLKERDLKTWSKSEILKSESSKIIGKVTVQGNSKVLPAKLIALEGLGDRFNGNHFVSSVHHIIQEGNWMTEISFGMSFGSVTNNVMAPSISGLLPAARGLFNATVKKTYEDPDNQFRILIDVPMFDQSGEGIWARLSNFYSSKGAGAFFIPEVGDEVVIGFLNEDPRYPIILGSLYSQPKLQPFEGLVPDEQNKLKAIVSKSQIQITFDDEDKVLSIKTPSNNTIVLNDKDQQIAITDHNKNRVVMSSSGVTIKSPKDIILDAGGDVKINSGKDIKLDAKGNIGMTGLNLVSTAKLKNQISAAAEVTIEGGATMKLNAAMIMIN